MITLINTVSDSALTGFILDEGNMHLELQKVPGIQTAVQPQTVLLQNTAQEQPAAAQMTAAQMQEEITAQPHVSPVQLQGEAAVQPGKQGQSAVQPEAEKQPQSEPAGTPVCSPLVGTFYSAPSENEPPFVKVGDTVKKGQVLGIIEAMKLMNEIECEQDGVVTAVLVENEQMVEYGQELFLIQ